MRLPEMGFMEDAGQEMFRADHGAMEKSQDPFKPGVMSRPLLCVLTS